MLPKISLFLGKKPIQDQIYEIVHYLTNLVPEIERQYGTKEDLVRSVTVENGVMFVNYRSGKVDKFYITKGD